MARLAQVWSASLGAHAVTDPAISVYGVHTDVGWTLTTRRLSDGTERWSTALPQVPYGPTPPPGPLAVHGDKIYVPITIYRDIGEGSGVHAYDAQTGAGGDIVAPKAYSLSVEGSTLIGAFSEYFGSCENCIQTRIDLTNLDDPSQDRVFGSVDILHSFASPSAGGGRLFLGADSSVRAFTTSASTGCPNSSQSLCPAWTRALGGTETTPVLSDDLATVYVGDAAGGVWALNAVDGTVLWKADVGGGGARSIKATPTVGGGSLYVTTSDGSIYAFDAHGCGEMTCPPQWTASTASPITTQAALAGGVLYVGSNDGTLNAYRASGCNAVLCNPVWKTSTGSGISGAPAVGLGYLVVGTADGRLIAYRAP